MEDEYFDASCRLALFNGKYTDAANVKLRLRYQSVGWAQVATFQFFTLEGLLSMWGFPRALQPAGCCMSKWVIAHPWLSLTSAVPPRPCFLAAAGWTEHMVWAYKSVGIAAVVFALVVTVLGNFILCNLCVPCAYKALLHVALRASPNVVKHSNTCDSLTAVAVLELCVCVRVCVCVCAIGLPQLCCKRHVQFRAERR